MFDYAGRQVTKDDLARLGFAYSRVALTYPDKDYCAMRAAEIADIIIALRTNEAAQGFNRDPLSAATGTELWRMP